MSTFSFLSPTRIEFGAGKVKELGKLLPSVLHQPAERCLVVTGKNRERAAVVLSILEEQGITCERVEVGGEPTVDDAARAVSWGRRFGPHFVLAVGGGSALDLAKAVAALLPNRGEPLDYLEVIGKGHKLENSALPSIALPTTSGTGAEVTKNAVLRSTREGVKVSLRDDSMIPRLALVDPELTYSVPPEVTAATGLDALTQCIEPFLSRLANPLTDGLAREGIQRGARALERAVHDGQDSEARADMALCSLFGGLSLANAKLGIVHGIAGVFGGMFESPHGAVCARLLPGALRINLRALRARASQSPIIERFTTLAVLLTGDPAARAEQGIDRVQQLVTALKVPALSEYGAGAQHVVALAQGAARASSTQGNPLVLTQEEVVECLQSAL